MRFSVTVFKEWTERGFVDIEAADEDDARDQAKELLADGDDSIYWQGSNMEPGQSDVEHIERTASQNRSAG